MDDMLQLKVDSSNMLAMIQDIQKEKEDAGLVPSNVHLGELHRRTKFSPARVGEVLRYLKERGFIKFGRTLNGHYITLLK